MWHTQRSETSLVKPSKHLLPEGWRYYLGDSSEVFAKDVGDRIGVAIMSDQDLPFFKNKFGSLTSRV